MMQQTGLTLLLEKSEKILSKDPDEYFIKQYNWFIKNFSHNTKLLKMYIEDLVENCLDLAVRHAFSSYVRHQEMYKQHHMMDFPGKIKKLTRPTTRTVTLPEKTTFKYTCITCHDLLVSPQSVCKCPGLPYAEHDNVENPECRKTCAERYPVEVVA